MLFTIVWAIWFILLMFFSIVLMVIYVIFKYTLGLKYADAFTFYVGKLWGRVVVLSTGSKVTVVNKEKLIKDPNICFVCNHQSYFDIPILLGWLGRLTGFVAKKELRAIPILGQWITQIHSVFLDRKNPRSAMTSLHKAAEYIRKGHAIVIFPEGSRSKGDIVSSFRQGSLKLAQLANAIIQPLTISGSWKIYEGQHRIRAAQIKLIIHDPIIPESAIYHDKIQLSEYLQHLMQKSL